MSSRTTAQVPQTAQSAAQYELVELDEQRTNSSFVFESDTIASSATTATTCPYYQRLTLFLAKVIGNRCLFPLLLLDSIACAAVKFLWSEQEIAQREDLSANERMLVRLSAILVGLGTISQTFLIPTLSPVMQEKDGALWRLGIDTVHIAPDAKRSLGLAAVALSVVAMLFSSCGCYLLARAILWAPDMLTQAWSVAVGVYFLFGGPLVCAGMFTMYIGGTLANNAILELILLVGKTSATDTAWSDVDVQAARLARETMPAVSSGWGGASIIIVATYWLIGLSEFIWWLHVNTIPVAVYSLCFFIFSFGVLWPLAVTSTNCDHLMVALNDNRLGCLGEQAACDKIRDVETALRRLNRDQGLGFCIGGVVVDKRKLNTLFATVISTASPIFAAIMALRPESGQQLMQSACSLGTEQAAALHSVALTFMNSSCVLNLTIAPGGVTEW